MNFLNNINPLRSSDEEIIKKTLSVDEVTALIRYASETGVGLQNNEIANLSSALYMYTKDTTVESHQAMLKNYTELVSLTKPQNGRIILENSNTSSYIRIPIVLTIFLVFLVFLNEGLANWLGDRPEGEEGWYLYLSYFQRYALDYLSPFLWGALGSCVYFLKRMFDLAEEGCFDSQKMHGWYLRVFLGAILASIVVHLYEIGQINYENSYFDGKALAFFTGLGVKIVYGAFERVIEIMAQKLNIGGERRDRMNLTNINTFLDRKIKETSVEDEAGKLKTLKNLKEDIDNQIKGKKC